MKKLLIVGASAAVLGFAALSAPQAFAHGGGGGGHAMSHGPMMGGGSGSKPMDHGGVHHADFKDHRKKGARRGHGFDAPDFDDDDDDDDGCTRVLYKGRLLWSCE